MSPPQTCVVMGRTFAGPKAYEADLTPFRMHNLLLDLLGALGQDHVAAVIGNDFGSWVTGYAALARSDVLGAVVLMSALFAGAPAGSQSPLADDPIHADLAAYCTRASTITTTLPRPPPPPTWTAARSNCARSCGPTSTTRASTDRATGRPPVKLIS